MDMWRSSKNRGRAATTRYRDTAKNHTRRPRRAWRGTQDGTRWHKLDGGRGGRERLRRVPCWTKPGSPPREDTCIVHQEIYCWVTLCTVCFLHFLPAQNVRFTFGAVTCDGTALSVFDRWQRNYNAVGVGVGTYQHSPAG